MNRGAWWAAVYWQQRVGHDWATNTYLLTIIKRAPVYPTPGFPCWHSRHKHGTFITTVVPMLILCCKQNPFFFFSVFPGVPFLFHDFFPGHQLTFNSHVSFGPLGCDRSLQNVQRWGLPEAFLMVRLVDVFLRGRSEREGTVSTTYRVYIPISMTYPRC